MLHEQVGSHVFCYQAIDNSAERLSSEQQCVKMTITRPLGIPRFVSPAPGTVINFYMRNMSGFSIQAESDNPYDTLIIEPTMHLVCPRAVASLDQFRFLCPSLCMTSCRIAIPPHFVTNCTTQQMHGQEMSALTQSMGRVRATDMAMKAMVGTEFTWNADINFGGYSEQICFRLTNPIGGSAPTSTSELCVTVAVPRCMYIAQGGDEDVRTIGEIFGLDWLTIWGSNVQVSCAAPAADRPLEIQSPPIQCNSHFSWSFTESLLSPYICISAPAPTLFLAGSIWNCSARK